MKRQPRVDETGAAIHGSQKQIQLYVNENPAALNRDILKATPSMPRDAQIEWVSPIRGNNFKEYWDEAFLDVLGLSALNAELLRFWPKGGPHWDALARCDTNANPGAILVEAKAHPTEIYNEKGCDASPESRKLIEASLRRTCEWLKVPFQSIWMGSLYQSANRIAHLFFFRGIAKVDAWLVNVYFVDDRGFKPTSRRDWEQELLKVKSLLGTNDIVVPYASEVFLPAIGDTEPNGR